MSTKQERAQLEELTAQVASLAALVAQVVGQPTAEPQSSSSSSFMAAMHEEHECSDCRRTFRNAERAAWSKTRWMAADKSERPYGAGNKPLYHNCSK